MRKWLLLSIIILIIGIGIFYFDEIIFFNVPKLQVEQKEIIKKSNAYEYKHNYIDYIIKRDYIIRATASREEIISYTESLKSKGFIGEFNDSINNVFIGSGLFKKNNIFVYVLLTKYYDESHYNTEVHISNYNQWM